MKRIVLMAFLLFAQNAWAGFDYDATGETHSVADMNKPDSGSYTICFWMSANDSAFGEFMRYGDSTRGWSIETQPYENAAFKFRIHGGSDYYTYTITPDTWNHYCVVKNGTWDNYFYKDGVKSSSFGLEDGTAQSSTDDFKFGFLDDLYLFQGVRLADVAYWTTVLSDADIADIADKSMCPTDATGTLEFFSTLDSTPTDTSSNEFTITTGGSPTYVAEPTGLPCGGAPPTTTTTTTVTTTVTTTIAPEPLGFNADFNGGFN